MLHFSYFDEKDKEIDAFKKHFPINQDQKLWTKYKFIKKRDNLKLYSVSKAKNKTASKYIIMEEINFRLEKQNQIRFLKKLNYLATHGMNILLYPRSTDLTENFVKKAFENINIVVNIMTPSEFLVQQQIHQKKVCLLNLKSSTFQCNQVMDRSKVFGYTYDLIDYGNRKTSFTKLILDLPLSFIVEPAESLGIKNTKVYQIFQPSKVFPYEMKEPTLNQPKFVHFGRTNGKRAEQLTLIAKTFPAIPIFIYSKMQLRFSQPNMHCIKGFFKGQALYNIIKERNTFVLSFSEKPRKQYYSNRVPMLCGYRGLIVQQHFQNIENCFDKDSMIIFREMSDLKTKIQTFLNNYDLQKQTREKAYEMSQKYSFHNYAIALISKMNFLRE
jgi:hypothetical protein